MLGVIKTRLSSATRGILVSSLAPFLALIDQALISATAFATTVMLGQQSKTELGAYVLAYGLLQTFVLIQRQTISLPYTIYSQAKPKPEQRLFFGSALAHQLVLAAVSVVLPLIAAGLAAGAGLQTFVQPLICVAIVAPGFLLRELFRQFAFAHLRFETAILLDGCATAAQLAGLALLLLLGRLNAFSAYLVIAAVATTTTAVWAFVLRHDFQMHAPAFLSDWTRNWQFARWALLCDLLGLAGAYFLPWIVAYHAGAGEAGVLAAAASLVGIGQLFMSGLSNFLLPKAAAAHAADRTHGLRRLSLKLLVFCAGGLGAFAVAMAIAGGGLAKLVFGAAFDGAGPTVTALGLSLLFAGLGSIAVQGLYVLDRPRLNLPADLAVFVAVFAVALILVPHWGAFGAACATAVAAVAGGLIRGGVFWRALAALDREGPRDKGSSKTEIETRVSEDLKDATGRPLRVSVVVCTYNRADLLPGALQSLLRLDIPAHWEFELLVVDNGSTDRTARVVAELMRASDRRMRYILEPTAGVAAARNTGVAQATGDWIAFCDDDQLADPAWLRELVSFARRRNFRVVGGAMRLILPPSATDVPCEVRSIFSETPVLTGPRACGRFESPSGGNALIERSVFEEVGLFDATLAEAGEDIEFFSRARMAGIAVWVQPAAIVHHRVQPSRLELPALIAASRRVGWGFCRRDFRAYGGLGLTALCLARLCKFAIFGPFRYGMARLSGNQPALLDPICRSQRELCHGGGELPAAGALRAMVEAGGAGVSR